MTFDATDRKAIREREKRQRQADEQRLNYTRHIMADRFGRQWMWDLLSRCHIFHTAFIGGAPDKTAFNLGEQNFGLQLLADIMSAAPADYQLMAQEAQTRDLANDRRDSDQRSTRPQHPGSPDSGRSDQGRVDTEYDPFDTPDEPELFN